MRPDQTLLAFDTSAAHCAAALLSGGEVIASQTLNMVRGQAESLMPLLEELLDDAGLGWGDLDAVCVGIGPGNFTGIRISVSAARGLALALGIPAIGISTFEVMRGPMSAQSKVRQLVSLPAPRGQVYLQVFADGAAQGAPLQAGVDEMPDVDLPDGISEILGQDAVQIAAQLSPDGALQARDTQLQDIAETIARIAADKLACPSYEPAKPAPLYVRAPDAAPPRDPAPVILPDPV